MSSPIIVPSEFWFEAAKYDVLPLDDRFAERGELPQLMSAQGSLASI